MQNLPAGLPAARRADREVATDKKFVGLYGITSTKMLRRLGVSIEIKTACQLYAMVCKYQKIDFEFVRSAYL